MALAGGSASAVNTANGVAVNAVLNNFDRWSTTEDADAMRDLLYGPLGKLIGINREPVGKTADGQDLFYDPLTGHTFTSAQLGVEVGGAFIAGGLTEGAVSLIGNLIPRAGTQAGVDVITSIPPLRQAYIDEVTNLRLTADTMLGSGSSLEDVARYVSNQRNDIKFTYQQKTDPDFLTNVVIPRNTELYGSSTGPSFDLLITKYQSQGLQGDDIFRAIIDSSSRTGGYDLDFNNLTRR